MSKLSFHSNLEDKKDSFNQIDLTYYKIDTVTQFNSWYDYIKKFNTEEEPYGNFFRGMNEAKYKLYNSAQRYWNQNNLCELKPELPYINKIQDMLDKAKSNTLLQQVFEYYDITDNEMDFPLLSILQHYGAPTPLMDWTYNIDIALFFAIQNLNKYEGENVIENYISIYCICKSTHQNFILNNLNYISANIFPSVRCLSNFLNSDKVVYISDFEISNFENAVLDSKIQEEVEKQSAEISKKSRVKQIRSIKPLTTYYNLNILAQKGIFIFNPHASKPLEEFAQVDRIKNSDERIFCYNINKNLVELIKLEIGKSKIDDLFIYPDLKKYANSILDDYIQSIVGS